MTGQRLLAVGQLRIDEHDLEHNAARCHEALARASAQGASLLVLPECALTGYRYTSGAEAWAAAIDWADPSLVRLSDVARGVGTTVVVGYLERAGSGLYNTAAVLHADGRVHHVRKAHLPMLGADRFATPARQLSPVFEAPFGRFGVAICYDLRFPEVCRALALAGADVVAVPVNWSTEVTILDQHVVPTRAVENRVFVAVADRVGEAGRTRHLGASQVVDPDGTRLTPRLHADAEVTIAVAEVDLRDAREKATAFEPGVFEIDVMSDRRPDLYGALTRTPCVPCREEQYPDA